MLESSRIRFLPHTKRVAPRDNSRPSSQYQQVVEVLGCCVRLPSTNPPPPKFVSLLWLEQGGRSKGSLEGDLITLLNPICHGHRIVGTPFAFIQLHKHNCII